LFNSELDLENVVADADSLARPPVYPLYPSATVEKTPVGAAKINKNHLLVSNFQACVVTRYTVAIEIDRIIAAATDGDSRAGREDTRLPVCACRIAAVVPKDVNQLMPATGHSVLQTYPRIGKHAL
jgi:hypothetical protein